jgi:hypothetical protein
MKIAPDEIRGSRTPTPPPSRRAGMIHPYISRIEIDLMGRLPVTIRLSSSPGEFHPEALTEPCLNLSIHTALHSPAFASREHKPSLEEKAHPGCPVGLALRRAMSSPSLHVHYRRFNATTG